MSTEITALPVSVITDAGASEPADSTAAAADTNTDPAGAGDAADTETKVKPEKTQEQREIDRLRRRLDNKTRQVYELRAQTPAQQQQQQQQQQQSGQDGDDDEPVTMTRAEMQRQIAEQAQKLAPSMSEQRAEVQRRQGIVQSLSKEWGVEKFEAVSADLEDVLGGLIDRSGKPTPATDAIFCADNPKVVIEYLTDPDNADEAERISKMTAVQAGRAIGKLEDKLEAEKSKAKPKPSKAPSPIEPARGGGVPAGMPNPSDTKAYVAWANAQDKAAR